jgi:hypothetical protein
MGWFRPPPFGQKGTGPSAGGIRTKVLLRPSFEGPAVIVRAVRSRLRERQPFSASVSSVR